MKRKLKQILDHLITEYGAENVKGTLSKCEPFASQQRASSVSSRKMLQRMHSRENIRVRSREKLLAYLGIRLSIYDNPVYGKSDPAIFTVWTHEKAKDGRSVEYIEPIAMRDDFVAWLKAQGWDADEDDGLALSHMQGFTHTLRNQEQRMRYEEERANMSKFDLELEGIASKWEDEFDRRVLGIL